MKTINIIFAVILLSLIAIGTYQELEYRTVEAWWSTRYRIIVDTGGGKDITIILGSEALPAVSGETFYIQKKNIGGGRVIVASKRP